MMADKQSYRYVVVDVFTDKALEGNPLAVFPDAAGLDDETMQRIAKELNLSETVFVLKATRADCAVQVRIFTPTREMPFAGHPTVGTSFVLLEEGLVPKGSARFSLEEKIGPVPVRVESGVRPLIWLTTPPIQEGPTFEHRVCAQVLGLEQDDLLPPKPQLLSAGNPTIVIAVQEKAAVDRAWLDLAGSKQLRGDSRDPVCVLVFAPVIQGAYSRMFAPEHGVTEDPATGSSTGPLAAYMIEHDLVSSASGTRLVSEQGTRMGRRSLLHVQINGERGTESIEVGGHVTPLVEAVMRF